MNTPVPFRIAIAAALATVLIPRTTHATEIVAHRGASHAAPENTLAAFRLAWEEKADAIELDTYLTTDGRIAVIHDGTTKRTATLDKKVSEQTLAELQSLDAGTWKNAKWAGEKIPSLEQVLAAQPEGKRIYIEIKCGPEILPELTRVIRASQCKSAQLVIIGFGYETMKAAKAAHPELEVLWITTPKKDSGGLQPPVEELIEKARAAGVDGLDLDFHFAIDAAFVSKVHTAKLKLGVWTVDAPETAKALKAAGVDAITTNKPALIRGED
jgi:glycerophosphoryl diester phosphodiesterase